MSFDNQHNETPQRITNFCRLIAYPVSGPDRVPTDKALAELSAFVVRLLQSLPIDGTDGALRFIDGSMYRRLSRGLTATEAVNEHPLAATLAENIVNGLHGEGLTGRPTLNPIRDGHVMVRPRG